MPGKHSKTALVMVALALAACRTPAPGLAPPAETLTLRLGATESTIYLARSLTQGFALSRSEQRVLTHVPLMLYDTALAAAETGVLPPAYTLVEYLPADSRLWAAPIGQDRLVIIAHPDLAAPTLSRTDLQALFSGRITTWAALGGLDLPVAPTSREPTSAGYAAFDAAILAGAPLANHTRLAPSYEALLRLVSETPGAIGYAPASSLPADWRPLDVDWSADGLDMTLYIIGPGEPQGALRDFIAWAQGPAGQAVVARTHRSIFTP